MQHRTNNGMRLPSTHLGDEIIAAMNIRGIFAIGEAETIASAHQALRTTTSVIMWILLQ